jgi:hypothetical protein
MVLRSSGCLAVCGFYINFSTKMNVHVNGLKRERERERGGGGRERERGRDYNTSISPIIFVGCS